MIVEKLISHCERTINARNLFRQSSIIEDNLRYVINARLKKIAKNINDDEQDSQSRHSFKTLLNFRSRKH